MVRKLSWLVALLALWCSAGAFALGLGDINLHSGLNQPMNADIDLLSVRSGEADSIKVTLGSVDDFAQAGLDRPYLLNQLRFLVVANRKGHYRIHVSSEQPIREPFLDFLIQVTWKGGQLQREYTVLLDPPVLLPAPVQRVAPPVTRAITPPPAVTTSAPAPAAPATPSAAPAVNSAPTTTSAAPSTAPAVAPDTYGPVRRSDTLWGIANRLRPDSSVTTEQMMQALLRANPDAFANNNVNNLKAGRILRVPAASAIEAIDPREARRETHTQNDAWRAARATPVAAPVKTAAPTSTPATPAPKSAPVAAATPTPVATPAPSQAQLKVLAPQAEDAAKANAAHAAAGATPAPAATPAAGTPAGAGGGDVQKELALANEAVETQRQETEDMRTRLTDLERQIATMQKLMAVKNEQLSAMQSRSGAAADKTPDNSLTNNPATLVMIGIVAVILAALLWIALRRRQADVNPFSLGVPVGNGGPMATPIQGAATGAAVAGAAAAASRTAAAAPPPVAVPTPVPEADPLAEADIYLAYGRYQQAEDLIKEAMHHDRSPELRVKLLEIYFAAKNSTAFEDAARDLRHEVGPDSPYWQRILPMGQELCPYSLLFNADQTAEQWDQDGGESAATDLHSAPTIPDSFDFDEGDHGAAFESPANQEHLDLEAAHDSGADALDEIGTKLDLARAYIDMGDPEGARNILDEVMQEGDARQQEEARTLLLRIGH